MSDNSSNSVLDIGLWDFFFLVNFFFVTTTVSSDFSGFVVRDFSMDKAVLLMRFLISA